ncbi:MAG TPA: hypothetical protein VN892_03200 [Solirubrobacteraceae bacterium]|jgi:hypothetical protein|nr:hypothetical protein [Solirubrobacteraceae bacterium]
MNSRNGHNESGSTTTSSKTTNGHGATRAAKRATNGVTGKAANGAARTPASSSPASAPVVLGDAYLAINQLAVYGAPVDAARECVDRGEDLEVSVRRMLDVGAALVQHGGNQATLDSVRSEVDRLVDAVSVTVAENLPRSVKEQLAGFREVLGTYMDPARAESVQRQLEKIMQAGARSQRQEVTKALLDEHGPFAVLRADLDGRLKAVGELLPHVVALREQLSAAERVDAEHERGTAKGVDYEHVVGETVAAALAPFRDTVEHVATELGSDRKRRGDYVVTLNPDTTGGECVRVVVECKARPRISVRGAMTELEAAMGNREATAGLLVLDNADGTALGGLALRAYPGNRVVVHLDRAKPEPLALEVACQLVRELALASARSRERSVDLSAMESDLASLTDAVERAKAIASGVRVARRGIQNIEDAYARLRSDATDALAQMARHLREVPDSDTPN